MTDNELVIRNKIFGVVEGFYGKPWSTLQRKDLFKRMKQLGLNTYMYAPKNDFKHRAYWRELYTVEEAEQLSSLISSAKESGITFYYAISPGLDMTYSNTKEISCLKRKLEQVSQFGCQAFALLFDDIEPEISETDKEVFQSFGHAQVLVTNEVYQALGQHKFLFCPTEYCTARAVPNIQNSEYLKTIGNKLIPDIDIMWTGNKVISKTLTLQSLQELSEVLKRPPVIWDNIHANDYDQKRVFLGPYIGRSTNIIPHIRGVLTNPNCEFESNFVAFHTISQWIKCEEDASNVSSKFSSDIKIELEDECGNEDVPTDLGPKTYHPKRALKLAIEAWLPEFNKTKLVLSKPSNTITSSLNSALGSLTDSSLNLVSEDISELIKKSSSKLKEEIELIKNDEEKPSSMNSDINLDFQPIAKVLANSLLDPPSILNPLEPMDCGGQSPLKPSSLKASDENMEESLKSELGEIKEGSSDDISSEEMLVCNLETENLITYEDLVFLVDLFYLPYEHGYHGLQFLNEFNWLINNAYIISNYRAKKAINPEKPPEVLEWHDRSNKFEKKADYVGRILTKLTFCKNKCLLYELYPYIWDLKNVISLLNSYVKWLSLGHVPSSSSNTYLQSSFTWFFKGYKEAFSNGEQEPWLFRGGLSGDLQRLLPVESVNDLFHYKPPDSPSSHIYTIRPYVAADEQYVYDICKKTYYDVDSAFFNEYPDLLGDRFIGSFLTLSTDFCFVVEDENGICGYCLAAPDSQQFQKKLEMAWLPDLCLKYPAPNDKLKKGIELNNVEKIINDIHESQKRKFTIPKEIYNDYPSVCQINLLDHVLDTSVSKRLLACLLAALKTNGSKGLFSIVNYVKEKNLSDFYIKLGFQEIYCPEELKLSDNDVFLGRSI